MARGEVKVEAPELRLDPEGIIEALDWHEAFGRPVLVEKRDGGEQRSRPIGGANAERQGR